MNFAPIVHAGAERIENMVIFRGLHHDPAMRNANDIAQAEEGGRTLIRAFKSHARRLGLTIPEIRFRDGDPQDIGVWARYMQQTITDADGLPVVFCVTGGTKPMALGGVLGAVLGGIEKVRLVHIDDKTLATRFVDGLQMLDAEQNGSIGLEMRVALSSYSEPQDALWRRLQVQAFYRSIADELEEFHRRYLLSESLQKAFIKRTEGLAAGRGYICGAVDASRNEDIAGLLRLFCGLEDCEEVQPGLFEIRHEEISKLLRGGWLEALLYNRAFDLALGRSDVEVAGGLVFRPGGAPEGEIDVALLVRGQLHAIEAKTSWFGDGPATEKTLQQVQNLKHTILGVPGRMLVVNPRLSAGQMRDFKANVEPRAKLLGVEFYLGPSALDDATREMGRLIDGV